MLVVWLCWLILSLLPILANVGPAYIAVMIIFQEIGHGTAHKMAFLSELEIFLTRLELLAKGAVCTIASHFVFWITGG